MRSTAPSRQAATNCRTRASSVTTWRARRTMMGGMQDPASSASSKMAGVTSRTGTAHPSEVVPQTAPRPRGRYQLCAQLMLVVAGGDIFTCSACHRPYIRPRGRSAPKGLRKAPKAGEKNYCQDDGCIRERNRLAAERHREHRRSEAVTL